ncbi:PIN-like domain-containing protein [Asanoa iriomotensis]|uniref:PIN like domain-containing protein n=1 Tax=Asanoa iriomotensis TaxID=234613 RepID=A0ABQ4C1K1_9ACTN|nr:PIN-like domain-containing protein [Asanoa iriomotensis]GIF56671.1 hypothetical protein Air01nite_27660 [Asanoa iriomotensis]
MPGLFDGFEGYLVHSDSDVDQALVSALIAVDANVLLNLYRYNERTTEDLMTIFERVADRLVVPHQAMREFHRNRLAAIGNPAGAAQEVRTALERNQRSSHDALARWAKQVALDDEELDRLQTKVDEAFDVVREAVGRGEPNRVRADTSTAEDRVLCRLSLILNGRVLACPADEAELIAEGNRRVEARVPPGYRDADKGDANAEGAAGDFLVFRQATNEAARRNLDLAIITGDEKEDWWWRHRNFAIGPRHEMVKEFFDLSGGRRLFLLTPRSLLQRSRVFDVEVSPVSVEDAARPLGDVEPAHEWTTEQGTSVAPESIPVTGHRQRQIISLSKLWTLHGITTGEVSRLIAYDQPNVYNTMQKLDELGIVERADDGDGPQRWRVTSRFRSPLAAAAAD